MNIHGSSPSRYFAIALLVAAVVMLEACYYVQAARGQLDVLNRRRPVSEVISDTSQPEALRERLIMVGEARDFAIYELLLPDNESYRTYADLERDFVVWNVIAAPEFSLEPKHWCYPVAGCVAYRGYFSEQAARKMAEKLESKGYDVLVGGVPAYSTLGRFDDPVLNTMMHWSDDDLVATLFHELAHQQLYVKDDTQFNESFASTVAETGLIRWRKSRGEDAQHDARLTRRQAQKSMLTLALSTREKLQELYSSGADESAMRSQKQQLLDALVNDVKELAGTSTVPSWANGTINNARLALIGLYEGRIDAFSSLLQSCDDELRCFYAKAGELALLDKEAREAELDRLGTEVAAGS